MGCYLLKRLKLLMLLKLKLILKRNHARACPFKNRVSKLCQALLKHALETLETLAAS